MNSRHLRFVVVSLASAVVAFGLFALGSVMAWQVFPYPAEADELQRQNLWIWHVLGERGVQFIFLAALGIIAARLHHPTWRTAVSTAVAAGLLFQAIAISVFIIRFGFGAYRSHHAFWGTLLATVSLTGLFGLFAVCRQYRSERAAAQQRDGPNEDSAIAPSS